MPRKKKSRRHKKHPNAPKGCGDNDLEVADNLLRGGIEEQSVLNITPANTSNGLTPNNMTPSPDLLDEVPKILLIDNSNKILRSYASSDYTSPNTPIRKYNSNCENSGVPHMLKLSKSPESVVSELNKCQYNTTLDHKELSNRNDLNVTNQHVLSSKQIAVKTDMSVQTISSRDVGCITETPRFNHDSFLDLDYEIDGPKLIPLSGYTTPLKRMKRDHIAVISSVEKTPNHIQDLNNLQYRESKNEVLNCSKVLSIGSLRKLRSFNELILNTSQNINYDNCELLSQDIENELVDEEPHETSTDDLSAIKNSFFTSHLYNSKLASTPIPKNIDKTMVVNKSFPNILEILTEKSMQEAKDIKKISNSVYSTASQVENYSNSVGVQTTQPEEKQVVSISKGRSFKEKQCVVSVSRRRTYKHFLPAVMYCKTSPRKELIFSSALQASLDRTESEETIAATKTFARFFAKIFQMCAWLGIAIINGFFSLFQLYAEATKDALQCPSDINCKKCCSYSSQVSSLTLTVEQLSAEIVNMKRDNTDKVEKLGLLYSKIEELKKDLQEMKGQFNARSISFQPPPPPPPPPPSPPPLVLPATAVKVNSAKTAKATPRKKSNENARPIISLEDILKVKLKKIGDRSTSMRRATEPGIYNTLRQVKLRPMSSRPHTPSNESPSSRSSISNSPQSSLTRLLTNVDTNVCRVKRLKRVGAYSFNDCSRRSRRERESSTVDFMDIV